MSTKAIITCAAIVAALVTFGGAAGTLWQWQPFALAGDVTELRLAQYKTAMEVWRMREDDLIIKGGAVDRELQGDPGNAFLLEQKQIINRELEKARTELGAIRSKRLQ